MEEAIIYGNMIRALREKVPHSATLTRRLVDKLSIEREAVYRRIRGEVPFTLREASIISKEFDLSIDSIIKGGPTNSSQFMLYIEDNNEPLESDFAKLGIVIDLISMVKDEPYSELYSSSNTLPQGIFLKYENISKFFLFKWMYQYENGESLKTFEELEPSPRMMGLQRQYAEEAKYIKNTTYIWDHMIFQYLVNDLKYFRSIKLIQPDAIARIKEELMALLNEIEYIAAKGQFDNGNKVSFYISNINFDSSYSYIETTNHYVSSIKAFTLNRVSTVDRDTFNKLKKWIQSLKRFSTLISESGEIQRVHFFEKQKQVVSEL